MLERLLLPLDGSLVAESIFPQLYPILKRRDSEIILLRVNEIERIGSDSPEFLRLRAEAERAEAEEYLERIRDELRQKGVQARAITEDGWPAETILRIASRENATLIAMSTHGRTGMARWALGSVTEKILRASSLPVLVSRSFGPASEKGAGVPPVLEREIPIRRILVPVDMSHRSLEIVQYAAELAAVFKSTVLVLHVLEGTLTQSAPEMRKAAEAFRERGIRTEPLLGKGDPAGQIIDLCRENGADLIAMTTHGRSGVSRWVLGSVTEKVLREARVPLLVVRGSERATIVLGP